MLRLITSLKLWVKKHITITILGLIISFAGLFVTVYLAYFKLEEPINELKAGLSSYVTQIRMKIVNLHFGCKGRNLYSSISHEENVARLRLTTKLAALFRGKNAERLLGTRAREQVACFILYNDVLSMRENVCESGILSPEDLIKWEGEIIFDIYNKSNKGIGVCLYGKIDMER